MAHFTENSYLIRKKILSFLGESFHIYDPRSEVVPFSRQKAFRLKEEIRVFTDEDQQTELFRIKARNIIDISATYDVSDSASGKKIGAWRRRGMKSIVRDEWVILDRDDRETGVLSEDNISLATVRRLVCNLIPQNYDLTVKGVKAAEFKRNFNPFLTKINLEILRPELVDRELLLAGAILLCAIEGKQD